ncbi:MAG: hypothetical protein ACE5KM_10615, partial [Planctomycetaceae bacterium]
MRLLVVVSILAAVFADSRTCRAEGLFDLIASRTAPKLQGRQIGRFLFVTDHKFDGREMARDLNALERRLKSDLGLPGVSGTVRIYVFQSHGAFSRYIRKHIPYLTARDTQRNGLFLLRNGKAYIFLAQHKRLTESARHEFVHTVVNAAIRNPPVWVDEGLAMYYETAKPGTNRPHLRKRLEKARRRGHRANAVKLDSRKSMSQMTPLDYAESWAWVRL